MTNKELQLYEHIHQYLEGALKGEDLVEFEHQLKVDEALAAEVALHRNLAKIVKPEDKQVLDLRDTLQKINRESKSATREAKKSAKIISFRRYILAAAAVFVLGVFSYLTYNSLKPNNLYAYQIEPLELTTKSSDSDEQLVNLQEKFNAGAYQEALNIANRYLEKYPSKYDVVWAKGVSQLELGNYSIALSTFQALDNMNRRESLDKAKWYTAMTHLKLNQPKQCKKTLQSILEESAYYPKEKNLEQMIKGL